MPDPIDSFFASYDPAVEEIANGLRALVRTLSPDATETLHRGWKCVSYGHARKFCAIAPHKESVNLQFHSGTALPDPARLLEGTGKSMRHVKLKTAADLKRRGLLALVRAAADQAQ